jgi:hypothetical protein
MSRKNKNIKVDRDTYAMMRKVGIIDLNDDIWFEITDKKKEVRKEDDGKD